MKLKTVEQVKIELVDHHSYELMKQARIIDRGDGTADVIVRVTDDRQAESMAKARWVKREDGSLVKQARTIKTREVGLSEKPYPNGQYQDLLRATVGRICPDSETETDLIVMERGRPVIIVHFPGAMTDAEVDSAVEEIIESGDDILIRERKARALNAIHDLETVERVIQEAKSVAGQIEETTAMIRKGGDTVDALEKLAKLLPAITSLGHLIGQFLP